MATLWYLARRRLARSAGATVALAALVALTSGSGMALVAGATRTQEALPRFVAHSRPGADASVFAQVDERIPFEADDQSALLPLLREIPAVTDVVRGTLVIAEGTSRTGVRQRLLAAVALDPGREQLFGRPIVVAGAWPDHTDPDSIAIDEELADRAALGVGDTYHVVPFTVAQFGPAGEGALIEPAGPAVDLRVAAIYRYPDDLQPAALDQEGIYVDHSSLELTTAYWETYGPDLARYGVAAGVVLADGATTDDLATALQERIPDRFVFEPGGFTSSGEDAIDGIRRAIDLQAHGMRLVAAVIVVTGSALLWLLFGRRAVWAQDPDAVLDGIGFGRRRRLALHAVEGAAIGFAGAAVGVMVAVAGSTRMPFGLARRAELDPGIDVDLPVLFAGVALSVTVVVAAAVVTARRALIRDRIPRRIPTRSTGVDLASRGLGPAATVGLRFALQPDPGVRSVPVRTAMAGVAAATAVVVAVSIAAASLDLVRDEPERRGSYGDVVVGNLASVDAAEAGAAVLDANPDVAAYTGETTNYFDIDGETISVTAYFDGAGDLRPLITEGRLPVGDAEIALGAVAMDRLDVGLGDTVATTLNGAEHELHVVGTALVDDVGGGVGGPGKAGLISEPALRRLDPAGAETTGPTWFVVRFAEGVDHEAALDRLRVDFPRALVTPRLPDDLRNVERLGGLAVLLAVVVVLLGIGAALVALLGAVRRHRRDLAVLRTLGFLRRQAAATVAWQATTFAAGGLAVGVPTGIVIGRGVWLVVVDGVGIEPAPVVPVAIVVVAAIAALVVVNLVAVVPAHIAGRLRPAEIVRAE